MLNREASTVTVGGGVTYSQLAPYLEGQGYALHNLASLPQITVAGAIATATHGSGNKNGNLATAVSAMEVVTADGEVLVLSRERDGDRFPGAAVNLGALGVVTKVTLDVQPTFQVAQVVYENLGMDQLERHLEEIFTSGYSVSLFTDWQNHRIGQVWVKRRVNQEAHHNSLPSYLGPSWQPRNSTRFLDIRRKVAPNNWAFPVPGMSGCLTSASTSRPAAGPSCSLSTWFPGNRVTKPSWRWNSFETT